MNDIEVAECWGQNHHGIWAHSVPEFVKAATDKKIKEAYIRGIYWCQDMGPVTVFECHNHPNYNSNLLLEIQELLKTISINTHNFISLKGDISLCPNTAYDDIKLRDIIVEGTGYERK